MNNSLLDKQIQLVECKKQLIKLLISIVDIHYVHFQNTEIYSKLSNLNRTFNYNEQDTLEKEIQSHFADFIRNLLWQCPAITRKEILICCLSFRFSMVIIGFCLGCSSTDTIRQHKFRIKNKMTVDSDNSFLFDFIFNYSEYC